MSEKRKWTFESSASMILRNGGKINYEEHYISIARPGLKILGAIDYLINYFGYTRA
jgi:hypothetical protein